MPHDCRSTPAGERWIPAVAAARIQTRAMNRVGFVVRIAHFRTHEADAARCACSEQPCHRAPFEFSRGGSSSISLETGRRV